MIDATKKGRAAHGHYMRRLVLTEKLFQFKAKTIRHLE